ncbi:MAG: aminotransferase class I/II-fold pyridoxal phosphate-dependent enzyme [Spirochaetales bacterium]|nr:aminotransferase class I/II-fold pyridoxal phosphate-dependent enzyme [Spirochaetales bacterium]
MNPLAKELNGILAGTACEPLLSDFGKRIYFPKGIVSQSSEATQHAHTYNATIGMAYTKGNPIELSAIKNQLPDLNPKEAVAYAPTPGDAKLRKLWKQEIYRKNPTMSSAATSEPVVVPGLTNGLSQITDLFINPGDTIVVPDMFWGNYRLMMEVRNQGIIKEFSFYNEKGTLNVEGFITTMRDSAVNGKITVLMNFPNNPTGYSPTMEEARQLAQGIRGLADEGYHILAITDDAYFGLFFAPDACTESMFSLLADIHENVLSVKIDGATKEEYVWGFRVGFVTINSKSMNEAQYEAFNKKLGGAIRASISNSSRPAQSMLLKALDTDGYNEEKEKISDALRARYDKVVEVIKNRTKGFSLKPLPFNSGYFMSFEFTGGNAEDLRKELLYSKGIGTISIKDTYLRIAYASVDLDQIEDLYKEIFEAADRLSS